MAALTSTARITLGLLLLGAITAVFAVVCVLLLPSRRLRIAACNVFGHMVGPMLMRVCSTTVTGDAQRRMRERRPAIFISNHTSIIDMFVAIWGCPLFTCGVAKREIVYYPFIGQLYLISGHLRVDRSNRAHAMAGMEELARLVRRHGLSIWIWPEGTRSRDGRLLGFKKGFAHLALATGLPVVPVVVKGAHRGWRKNSLIIAPTSVAVDVLAPIRTSQWRAETLDQHIAAVHAVFNAAMPEDQRGPAMGAAPAPPADAHAMPPLRTTAPDAGADAAG